MGGVTDKVKQFGRYIDPSTKQGRQNWAGASLFGTAGLFTGELLKKPKVPQPTELPPPPDITDKAVQAAMRAEATRRGSGSRRNSFITGPLGDQTNIPVMGKSVITGG